MTNPYQPSEKPVFLYQRGGWQAFAAETVQKWPAHNTANMTEGLFTASQLAAEVERAVAAERERCAKLCDRLTEAVDNGGNVYRREAGAGRCAAAIRKGADDATGT